VKRWPWKLKLLHYLYLARKQKVAEDTDMLTVAVNTLHRKIGCNLKRRHMFRFR